MRHEFVGSGSRHQTTSVRFPFLKLFGWLFLLLIGIMVVYRLSEAAGTRVESACEGALIVSLVAAVCGLIPIYKVWGKELLWVMLGVFFAGVIRLLIGLLGVVIIILFTDIQRMRFVGFLVLFYVPFLMIDTWLSVWASRHAKVEQDESQETAIHGNIWDIVVRG